MIALKLCSGSSRSQWLRESETIVNVEHSLLFCAPPNTGSLQFRMLAKRMKVSFMLTVYRGEGTNRQDKKPGAKKSRVPVHRCVVSVV